MLLEKYPIIIEDSIVDIDETVTQIFKYQYITKTKVLKEKNIDICNKNRFSIIYNKNDNKDIIVQIKRINQSNYVDIILHPFNTLILPFMWTYKLNEDTEIIKLNDIIHFFLYGYFD
jgi:hypothetical protein